MKILFVLESFYPNIGGVETLFKSLADELSRKKHRVMIITTHPGRNVPAEEEYENVSIRRYRFVNRYFFTLFAFIPVLLNAGKYDLIHTTSYNAGFPAFIGGILNRKKTIITFHEYWGGLWFKLPHFSKISLLGHFIFEWLLVQIPFTKFIAVSDYTKKCLLSAGVSTRRVDRIYNGINYSKWQRKSDPDPNPEFQFLYFGRLGISKGINVLLEATNLLKGKETNFKLTLILPANPRGYYQRVLDFIKNENLSEQVIVLSHLSQSELIEKISAADAVVIPSYSEGFCYSAVESVALGKLIINSGKGALPEVVSGKYITLDQLTAIDLSEAMEDAMAGVWDFKEIRNFPLKDTVDQYIQLYEQIIHQS